MKRPADDSDLALLAYCASRAESAILCAYLAAHGIPVSARGDSQGAGPSAIEVMVPQHLLDEAEALVTAFHQSGPLGDDWDDASAKPAPAPAPLPRAVVHKG